MHLTMVRLETPICEFGSHWSLQRCRGDKGLLVMFISNHCPYVKAIRTKLVRDAKELSGHGINCVAIMPNDTIRYPDDSLQNMKAVSAEFGFPFPYLIDESQDVARAYGAVCTPDFFGYNADLQLQYRGRMDSGGARPDMDDLPRELFEAMKQVAETGRGPEHQIPSMGCSIKWRED
jgi:thiol-disulfide isomerase/thioredoxin